MSCSHSLCFLALLAFASLALAQSETDSPEPSAEHTPEYTPAYSPEYTPDYTPEHSPDYTPEIPAEIEQASLGTVPTATSSPTTASTVCVDEAYLRRHGHTTGDFVHAEGLMAETLCPPGGLPCGTPNHKVRVDGADMSYADLCATMVCGRLVIKVNSVYTHRWEERRHGRFVMTMYDIRHIEAGQRMLHWGIETMRRATRW